MTMHLFSARGHDQFGSHMMLLKYPKATSIVMTSLTPVMAAGILVLTVWRTEITAALE